MARLITQVSQYGTIALLWAYGFVLQHGSIEVMAMITNVGSVNGKHLVKHCINIYFEQYRK